jgi:uncharacterized protein YydD (DUF2326 family)
MGTKVDFSLDGGLNPSRTSELEERVLALYQWATIVENRQQYLQDGLLNLVGSFEGLVGLIIEKAEVTTEELNIRKEKFLEQIKKLQEEARAKAVKKTDLWVPESSKIVPSV